MLRNDANARYTFALLVAGLLLLASPLYAPALASATTDDTVVEYRTLSPEARDDVDQTLDPDRGAAPSVDWEGNGSAEQILDDDDQWTLLEPADERSFEPAIAREVDELIPDSSRELGETGDVYIKMGSTYYEATLGFIPCLGYRMALEPTDDLTHLVVLQRVAAGSGILSLLGMLVYNANVAAFRRFR